MNKVVWVTIGLFVVVAILILNAGRTGFVPLLYAWPLLVLLAAVPGLAYVLHARRRKRDETLVQGEVAWRRYIEVKALTKGRTDVTSRLEQSARTVARAKDLQEAEDLIR